mmetsp:Transcript_75135/g.110127  ORF Transcript_75135/g.110127 Transcript_75135/m.110127 type:complete len:231 (+) Transcript_75135:227-919(+)
MNVYVEHKIPDCKHWCSPEPAIVGHELAPIPIFLGIRILKFQSDTSATRTFEFDDVCLDPPYHFRGFQKVPVERRDADLSYGLAVQIGVSSREEGFVLRVLVRFHHLCLVYPFPLVGFGILDLKHQKTIHRSKKVHLGQISTAHSNPHVFVPTIHVVARRNGDRSVLIRVVAKAEIFEGFFALQHLAPLNKTFACRIRPANHQRKQVGPLCFAMRLRLEPPRFCLREHHH